MSDDLRRLERSDNRKNPSDSEDKRAQRALGLDLRPLAREAPKQQHRNQLSPLGRAWRDVYPDAEPPWGLLARYCAPLLKAHPVERVVMELRGYLKATPRDFLNLSKFSYTFGTWTPRVTPSGRRYQSADEADRAAGILP